MMKSTVALLLLSVLAAPAQALKMSVWDRELQTKLGDGETVGSVFTAQLVGDYQGPVVILFALSDDDKARGTFAALKTRYDGVLEGGQLNVQGAPGGPAAAVSLAKFLGTFKLKVNLQPAGQSLSLPGLKSAPRPGAAPGTPTVPGVPGVTPGRQK